MLHYPNIDPVIWHIYGPLAIRWYSLPYLFGAVVSYFYIIWCAEKHAFKISKLDAEAFVVGVFLWAIVGARTLYVWLYDFDYFWHNPVEIFYLWQGGMSFHGGFIGVVFFYFYRCKKRPNVHNFMLADCIATIAPFAIFFGRIANFINSELYGRATNFWIGMIFPTDSLGLPRHPSQLYEAIFEGLFLGLLLLFLRRNKFFVRMHYASASIFIFCYGFVRFFMEFFREPDSQIGFVLGWLTMGQVLSAAVCFVGIFVMKSVWKKTNK